MTFRPDNSEPAVASDAQPLCGEHGPSLMDLSAFADGRVTDDAKCLIQVHVSVCPICREAVNDLAQTSADDSRLFLVPQHVLNAAMGLVPAGTPASRNRWTWHGVRRSLVAAAVVAACIAGHYVGSRIDATPIDEGLALEDALSFGLLEAHEIDADLLGLAELEDHS